MDAGENLVKSSNHLCSELLKLQFQGLAEFDKLLTIMAPDLIYLPVELGRISVVELGRVADATDPFHQSLDLTLQCFEAANHFELPEVFMHRNQAVQLDSSVDRVALGVILGVDFALRAVLQLRFEICKLWVLFEVGLAGIDLVLLFKFDDSSEKSLRKFLLLT